MTDILLGPDGDLFIENGQLKLIDSIEVLTRQRLLNKLRTITGTLFTNINYGIDRNLLFKKGTKDFLDQNIQSLIDNTTGVIRLVEFESSVNLNREYVLTFKYEIETGEIVGIRDLGVSSTGDAVIASGIWVDGYWDYSGTYEFTEVWGEEGEEPMVYPKSEQVSVTFFLDSHINLTETEKGYDVEFLPGDGPGYFTLYISADTIAGGTYLVSGNLVQGEGSSYLEIYPDDAEDYQNITGRFSVVVKPDGEPLQIYLRHTGIPSPSVLLEDLNVQLIAHPVDSFGSAPMEIDPELTSVFSTVSGGSPATNVVLEPTTATITNPNEGSSVVSAIRSTIVATSPVYFELNVEAPDGHTEEEILYGITVNLDGDNHIAVLMGGSSSVEAGEDVQLALGDNGISANLFRDPPSIVTYLYASGESSSSVGAVRLGVAYDPSAGTYTFYVWTTGGATFQYPTVSDTSTVAEFGPYNLHPQETANHFSTTTVVVVPDTVVGDVVYRLISEESEFGNPNGAPSGYSDLSTVSGGDTAEHTIPFLTNNPF